MRKSIVVHPFLFTVFPVLFLYAYNVDFALLDEALLPMAIATGFAILLFSSLGLILKDREKAGLLVSLIVLPVFSHGHLSYAMEGFRFGVGEFIIGPDKVLTSAWGILFVFGAYFLVKTRRNLHTVTSFLNVVSVSLVAISMINIVSYEVGRSSWSDYRSAEDVEANSLGLEKVDTLPDIYYIILDAYGSANSMKRIWDYDNQEFIDYLTERDFYIGSESRSNYAVSFLSLASSLNMEYLNHLTDTLGVESRNRKPPYQMIQDSRVMRFLKSKGYRFVHFRSGWGPTDRNEYADWDVQCGRVNEFMRVLVRTTILRPLERHLIARDRRERVLCTFSTLAEVQDAIEGPRFVFAHILVPHHPFIFGPNGERAYTDPEMAKRTYKQRYLDQLRFVNGKVKVLVEMILSEAETSPIIILQGDHGPSSIFSPGEPSHRMLEQRMGILNAYYLPNNGKDLLYDSITPVNTFRVIFNRYFNTSYDLLEDKIYFSELGRPYKFIDVTDILTGR